MEKLTASVNIPKSYLDRIAAQQADPKAADKNIEKIAAAELPKIKALVKPLINAANDDQVVVNWFYDIPVEQKAAAPAQTAGWLAFTKDYGPQLGMGLLAVISLFGVMRIAKKAQSPYAMPGKSAPAASLAWAGGSRSGVMSSTDDRLPSLGGGPQTVGEATEIDGVMVGHEVDERTVRVQHIAKQIGQMIKEDPVAAAGIVQHWLTEHDE